MEPVGKRTTGLDGRNDVLKIEVYTALTWDNDKHWGDWKCFTQQDYNRFSDPRRNSRIFKILPHLWIEADWSIYIDATIVLNTKPETLVALAGDRDWAVFAHPHRKTIDQERTECKRLDKDDHGLIDRQVDWYASQGYNIRSGPLAICGIQIRRHTDEVKWYCERWWAEYCRWSCRDQLSFPYAVGNFAKIIPHPGTWNNQYFQLLAHQR